MGRSEISKQNHSHRDKQKNEKRHVAGAVAGGVWESVAGLARRSSKAKAPAPSAARPSAKTLGRFLLWLKAMGISECPACAIICIQRSMFFICTISPPSSACTPVADALSFFNSLSDSGKGMWGHTLLLSACSFAGGSCWKLHWVCRVMHQHVRAWILGIWPTISPSDFLNRSTISNLLTALTPRSMPAKTPKALSFLLRQTQPNATNLPQQQRGSWVRGARRRIGS